MNTDDNKNLDAQEIDLRVITRKISKFFRSVNKSIFLTIEFVRRNAIKLGLLFVIGFGLGLYLDITKKVYDNEIIIRPNFESTDYAYSKVELLRTKIKDRDTLFLKSIGIKNPSKITSIRIAPIVDLYKFIGTNASKDNDQNIEILKLLAEDGDMKTIVSDKTTSKNYPFHKITITTKAVITKEEVIQPIINYLENNAYFVGLKDTYQKSIQDKIQKDNETIAQIDGLLSTFSKESDGNLKNDKLVYYNENTQLNDIIQSKRELVLEISRLEFEKKITDKVVKENSTTINILNANSMNGKKEFIFPILLILSYLLIYSLINYYKKLKTSYKEE